MNDQTQPLTGELATAIPAEVRLFLAVVRRELSDLDPEELTEITDGLEADLADLVAERGPDALGDPKLYARELRSAAGITEAARPKKVRGSIADALSGFLDACRAWFDHQRERLPGDQEPVLAWLHPTWWVFRAWIAVQLVDLIWGGGNHDGGLDVVPSIFGALGWILWGVATWVSIQIGRGMVWPGGERGVFPRLVLLGLNIFAVAMVPAIVSNVNDGYGQDWDVAWNEGHQAGLAQARWESGYPDGDAAGTWLSSKGRPVTNIYAYDAQGRRMAGVQLFDQDGRPLEVAGQAICPRSGEDGGEIGKEQREGAVWVCHDSSAMQDIPGYVLYPWTNGQAQLKNVFPLAGREQETLEPSPTAFQEVERPTLGEWPFAEVPRVSLPGITSGILEAPQKAGQPATTR